MIFQDYRLWSLGIACALLIAGAVLTARTGVIPNALTLPSIAMGWLLGVLISLSFGIASNGGGIGSSFAASITAFGLLFPVFAMGFAGAGTVKLQVAVGAWVGCAYGPAASAWIIFFATLAGVISTVFAAIVFPKLSFNPFHRLFGIYPIQVPFSIGSIAVLIAAKAIVDELVKWKFA